MTRSSGCLTSAPPVARVSKSVGSLGEFRSLNILLREIGWSSIPHSNRDRVAFSQEVAIEIAPEGAQSRSAAAGGVGFRAGYYCFD